jgi:hypothetical protein
MGTSNNFHHCHAFNEFITLLRDVTIYHNCCNLSAVTVQLYT